MILASFVATTVCLLVLAAAGIGTIVLLMSGPEARDDERVQAWIDAEREKQERRRRRGQGAA